MAAVVSARRLLNSGRLAGPSYEPPSHAEPLSPSCQTSPKCGFARSLDEWNARPKSALLFRNEPSRRATMKANNGRG
jgi:hypothetical protein